MENFRGRAPSLFELFLHFCSGLILLFIIAPLAVMLLSSSPALLLETTQDLEVQKSITLTLLCSFAAAALFSIVAIPFAYILARRDFPLRNIVLGIIDLPVIIPHSAAGIALLGVLNRDSILGKIAENFNFSIIGSPIGIAFAMAFVSLPFLITASRDGFASVPIELEKTALTLGATPFRVFCTISLPLAKRSILTGFIMMFARGLSEFGAVIIIAYHPMSASVLIYERFSTYGLSYARSSAIIFLIISLLVFAILRGISQRNRLEKS